MTTKALLTYLYNHGVKLWVEGERLHYNAPENVLTPTLLAEMAAGKAEIIAQLHLNDKEIPTQAPPLLPAGRKPHNPLSFSQQRLWFLSQLLPDNVSYHIPLLARLQGKLNKELLQNSLGKLIQRHETLRTVFTTYNGDPVQVILPSIDMPVRYMDMRNLASHAQQTTIQHLLYEEMHRPFDLTQGPLLRFMLIQTAQEDTILSLIIHHIISDYQSIFVLQQELGQIYAAALQHQPASLPDLTIQYVDFALWQRKYQQTATFVNHLAYWRTHLANLPTLNLPLDYIRPAVQSSSGAQYTFALSPALVNDLKHLCQQEEVTLFMALLAPFLLLLSCYSRQDDLVVGTPITGRTHQELENLVGFFVNSLVLRTNVAGNPSFRELLQRVRDVLMDAYTYADVPFEKLVEIFQPERDLSRNPLFQVLFQLHQASPAQHALPGLTLTPLSLPGETTKFDLTLTFTVSEHGLQGEFEYNTSLFAPERIQRMSRHLQHLLEALVHDPEQKISSLALFDENEREELLVTWNDTQQDYYLDTCLHHLFEEQTTHTPDATALTSGHDSLTYAQLNQRANQLAHYLRTLEVGPETIVGLCLERSLDMVIGLLAILKAGGVYLPLDPTLPIERLAFMLDDSQAILVLTQQRYAHLLPSQQRSLLLDEPCQRRQIASQAINSPEQRTAASNAAYLIYTSGSTGTPKGVINVHRGIVNRLTWMRENFPLQSVESVLQKTPFTFDISIWEFFWPLLSGARLVMARPEGHKESDYLINIITTEAITAIHFVPSMLHAFLEESNAHHCTSLKRVICSGEPFPLRLQERFFQRLEAEIYNLYGPTEASIEVTVWHCQKNSPLNTVPLGHPIANTQIYVLNHQLDPVPVGVLGDLYIGGVGVARGYFNQPALTGEKFIPNPFSTEPGSRLYRTGDLARYLPDGSLEFSGRSDYQIKLRGYRIEPGEIETLLEALPAVRQSVVTIHEPTASDQRLVAYIAVEQQEQSPTTDELRTYLLAHVPAYMVPTRFVLCQEIPLTPNGKIDRKALLTLTAQTHERITQYVAPHTRVERMVAEVWADVLGKKSDEFGIQDNFFELGGHSLLATKMMIRLRTSLHRDISLRRFFEAPTIAGLLDFLRLSDKQAGQRNEFAPLPTLLPNLVERFQPFPLTDIQQAYWAGRNAAFELGNIATHSYLELDILSLDLERFTLAWQLLIARHDMLRAIVLTDGSQQILEQVPTYQIKTEDLRGVPYTQMEQRLTEIRDHLSHQVLPLDQWPLFSLQATLMEGQCIRLHLSIDALICDGWSLTILMNELLRYYLEPHRALPTIELSFRDYVIAEQAMRHTDLYQDARAYWDKRLLTLPPAPALPLITSPGSIKHPRFVRRTARLENSLWAELKTQAARAHLTPSGVVLAAFADILTLWSQQPHFTLNLTLFSRLPLHPQVDELVGDFTSLTLLEIDNSEKGSFLQRAQQVQKQLWSDLDHRYVSGVYILRELARIRGSVGAATMPVVFTSMLIQETLSPPPPSPEQPVIESVSGVSQTPQVWLDHQVFEENGMLVWNWDAVEDLFPTGLLDSMFVTLQKHLERLATDTSSWQAPWTTLFQPEQLHYSLSEQTNASHPPVDPPYVPLIEQDGQLPEQLAVISSASRQTSSPNNDSAAVTIAQLVSEILGIDVEDNHLNLLNLGANSIDMIRIVNRVEKELHYRPSIAEFLHRPTISTLLEGYRGNQQVRDQGRGIAALATFELLSDPEERDAYKARHLEHRQFAPSHPGIPLSVDPNDKQQAWFARHRRSHRHFTQEPLSCITVGNWLACLRRIADPDGTYYLYPSPGGLYPVQTYLYIKAGRIEGLAGGIYYYDPFDHCLKMLIPGVEIESDIYEPFINAPAFEEAAFALFLITQLRAIAPLYGESSYNFGLLEAGYMGQTLMLTAPSHQLGICPIGWLDFERIKSLFVLDENHVLVHSLLGGGMIDPIDTEEEHLWLRSTAQPDSCNELEREEI